ncbi:hypothetical protein [Parerythrobacter jejuensis]|uniref:Uncharacterized protein n=1 Tax=Parerythrobacter jejuensis TaxID=795812 RepID=A0A845AWK7_9SPHN|nr:hypothetical protein [Parerythrobacter jejuensis]MXP32886.1 hypothetical protein [Parerythrobacter jejuensis]
MIEKTASANSGRTFAVPRAFLIALAINFVWINASEVWRYLYVIKPMLHEAFPGEARIAPFDLATFAIWSLWDLILVAAATGFYWLFLKTAGPSFWQAITASILFTLTVFGLLWLGVYNMGLVPARFIWVALPLAWAEQAIAAFIVWQMLLRPK